MLTDNYPPSPIQSNQTDSAWHFPYKGEPLMETSQDELKAHLMATNEEFRALATEHCQYHKELEKLEAKAYLTDEEQAEEHRLKKVKLRLKDQMIEILGRYKTQKVA
jgi:uncharacterized protein YdcH (DUF465 family)